MKEMKLVVLNPSKNGLPVMNAGGSGMGWWGYEPWESDTFGDMCGHLWQPMRSALRRGRRILRNIKPRLSMRAQVDKWLDDHDYLTRYAAAGIVIRLYEGGFLWCGDPIMEKALRFLRQLVRISDKMGWREPNVFWKTCCKMIRRIEKAWLLSGFEKDRETIERIAEEEKKKSILKVKTRKRYRRVRRKKTKARTK